MKKDLSDRFISNLKPPAKKRWEQYSDQSSPNLVLRVFRSGVKSFVWQGRVNGVLKSYTLGPYPLHKLADARTWADSISEGRDRGIDVMEVEKEKAKEEEVKDTRNLDWLFELYMENEGGFKKSAPAKHRIYNTDIKPVLGLKRVVDITYDDLAEILVTKYKVAPVMSNRIQALIARLFKWATTKGRPLTGLTNNPALSLVKLATEKGRKRHLSDNEMRLLMLACKASESGFAEAILFLLHTGARKSEAFEMLWSELTLSTGQWILPADRAKNDQELLLMLPPVMVKMLEERKKATGNWDHVWPGKFPKVIPEGYKSKPLNCFSQMLVQMQKRMEAIASKETGYEVTIPHWTIHDIRRSVSTGMNGLSDAEGIPLIPGDIVERVINHKILGVAGRYNRADYLLEKKRALQLWADHLASLVA